MKAKQDNKLLVGMWSLN